MADKHIVLITGGNTGIGYESVKALYASPNAHTIIMGSRSLGKAKESISTLQSEVTESKSEVIPLQVDIEDDESIEKAFKEVEGTWGKVDSLVNNAGVSFDYLMHQNPGAAGIRAAWNRAYAVNVTSTQVFTTTFMPLLLKSNTPRLLFVTSGLSSLATASTGRTSNAITAPPPAGWPKPAEQNQIAYRSSKAALNMMMLDWMRVLKPDGVNVFAISPGFLATGLAGMPGSKEMMKKFGAGDPSIGGIFIKDVVEGKRDADSGKVINKDGLQPW